MKRRIVITIEVETNLDDDTAERRIETLLCPWSLDEQLPAGETLDLLETTIEVAPTARGGD